MGGKIDHEKLQKINHQELGYLCPVKVLEVTKAVCDSSNQSSLVIQQPKQFGNPATKAVW
jgi:hypothetical protein